MNIVLIVLIVAIIAFVWFLYNSIIVAKLRISEALSQIDVQLKRRADLIPNLVETVKGYAKHEKRLFEKVTELRASAMKAEGPIAKGKAEAELANTLKTVFAVAENYPELKADASFMKLQDELSEIESEVQSSRRYYNGAARDYNMKLQVFPTNLVAGLLGFKKRDFFE